MTEEESTSTIDKIGKYRVTGELGRGGMGVVYKGEDRQIGRQVAIKTLTDVTPELRERFYIEARSGILSHQNIVTVYEVGEHEGRPFIAMELVEGESLEKVLRERKRLPPPEALSIVEQICAGLGHAHRHGVVHRDVKPANVLVRPDGRVTIVDFGIARLADQTRQLTKTDTLLGTFHYIAPERLKGEDSDGRADIWSVGVMLYEMVTGALPFKGSDISSIYRVIHEPYVPVVAHVKDMPEGLSRVLDKALAKRVEERYATAEEMASDVRRLTRDLKGEEEGAREGDRTVLVQAPRIEQRKAQGEADPEETQEVLQTIPIALVKDGREPLAPANHDHDSTGWFEMTPRKQAEPEPQTNGSRQFAEAAPKPRPANASSPVQKPLEQSRSDEDAVDLKAKQRRTAELHQAVEKAVAACNKAIAANHLDRCMGPVDEVAKRYGESLILFTAREACRAKRSEKATHLLREAMQTARQRLRGSSAKGSERALNAVEYALPFADEDVRSEWRRLKDESAAARIAKQPAASGASPARRGKARWYAAGFIVVAAALAVAAVSYRRHEVAAAPKDMPVHAPIPAPVLTDMEINASPWAKVVRVEDEAGASVLASQGDQTTPLRLDGLKSGKYKVTLAGADGNQQTVECNVSPQEHLCTASLGSPDTDQLLTGGQS